MNAIGDHSQSIVEQLEYSVALNGNSLNQWLEEHGEILRNKIETEGAVLLRGLSIISSVQFGQVSEKLFGVPLVAYANRSTPRKELKGNVYTSTEYPPEEWIPLHNENAYSHEWPMKIAFLCLVAPAVGGETPIADSRRIYRHIPLDIREKFECKQVMYLRNYGKMGLPWQEVFQVQTQREVEDYCNRNKIEFSWQPNGGLRTWQICPAVQIHPKTGEKVWFNQAHLFHVSNHTPVNRQALLETFSEEELPRHAYYGDGEPMEEEYLDIIRAAIEREKVKFPWQRGDLLLLDNMLYCHGREPYEGTRRIIVSMAEVNSLSYSEACTE